MNLLVPTTQLKKQDISGPQAPLSQHNVLLYPHTLPRRLSSLLQLTKRIFPLRTQAASGPGPGHRAGARAQGRGGDACGGSLVKGEGGMGFLNPIQAAGSNAPVIPLPLVLTGGVGRGSLCSVAPKCSGPNVWTVGLSAETPCKVATGNATCLHARSLLVSLCVSFSLPPCLSSSLPISLSPQEEKNSQLFT